MNKSIYEQALDNRDVLFNLADTLEDFNFKFTNPQLQALEAIIAYNPITSSDCRRLITACKLTHFDLERLARGEACDSGISGKVKECLRRDSKSRINRVQAQGKNDAYITIDNKRYPLEIKTNGGRIQALYNKKSPDRSFILYELDITIKAGKPRKNGTYKPEEHRQLSKVLTVEKFLQVIEDTKAYKVIGHNESDKEIAVQADSKKLYEALQNFKDYTREEVFSWSDFI